MSGNKDYKVGYRRPPEHSRFRPGQSGNPRGRPRQRRNFRTVLDDTLQQTIEVIMNGRPCRMKRIDALVRTTVDRALKNEPKATAALMVMMRQTGAMGESTEPVSEMNLSAHDEAIMKLFMQRQGLPQEIPSTGSRERGRTKRRPRRGGK